jgi:DNA-binding response OmpR family regulator
MRRHGLRLLLVEDRHETRVLLRRMLTLCGWQVTEAATVAAGLAGLDPPPDCLVLDLRLPDGDGEVILRRVRSENLATRVVVNTGEDSPARLEGVRDLKPDALLIKPLGSAGLSTICGMAKVV